MTEAIKSYRDLIVWQQAMDLAVAIYALTKNWPKSELYGLTSQIRRSATSIPANIAEGYGRESPGSYVQFLRIAQGSIKELETHLILASRIGMAKPSDIHTPLEISESIGKLLRRLIARLVQP